VNGITLVGTSNTASLRILGAIEGSATLAVKNKGDITVTKRLISAPGTATESIASPVLGLQCQANPDGLLVTEVTDGGPPRKRHCQGMLVSHVNGISLKDSTSPHCNMSSPRPVSTPGSL